MKQTVAQYVDEIVCKLKAAGLRLGGGGYPVNPSEEQAYRAAFQRGVNWAFQAACRGEELKANTEFHGPTADDAGQFDGWNAAVNALTETENG